LCHFFLLLLWACHLPRAVNAKTTGARKADRLSLLSSLEQMDVEDMVMLGVDLGGGSESVRV
jgi:hypothetical protein